MIGEVPCTATGVDPEWFFSDDPDDVQLAKDVCAGCTSRDQCLADYLYEPYGMFGGLTQQERSEWAELRPPLSSNLDAIVVERLTLGERVPTATKNERDEAIRVLLAKGHPYRQVAEHMGLSKKTIERRLVSLRHAEVLSA